MRTPNLKLQFKQCLKIHHTLTEKYLFNVSQNILHGEKILKIQTKEKKTTPKSLKN